MNKKQSFLRICFKIIQNLVHFQSSSDVSDSDVSSTETENQSMEIQADAKPKSDTSSVLINNPFLMLLHSLCSKTKKCYIIVGYNEFLYKLICPQSPLSSYRCHCRQCPHIKNQANLESSCTSKKKQ